MVLFLMKREKRYMGYAVCSGLRGDCIPEG